VPGVTFKGTAAVQHTNDDDSKEKRKKKKEKRKRRVAAHTVGAL